MQIELTKYLEIFTHLRKGVTKFGPAPHKLILLLAVIREIEAGRVIQNRIEITNTLIESFMTVWSENVHFGHTATFALPFFHLQSEGFWQLYAYPQHLEWLKAQDSISSVSRLRETVQYASLSADLFELLVNPLHREVLKKNRPETLKVEKHLKKTMQLYYRHF
jgi:putative restriction endonuclease